MLFLHTIMDIRTACIIYLCCVALEKHFIPILFLKGQNQTKAFDELYEDQYRIHHK